MELITKAKQLLQSLYEHWEYTTNTLGIDKSLGTKFHYLAHCIHFMEIWQTPLGFITEQSVEAFHQTCTSVFNRYKSQKVLAGLKHAIHYLMLITSPTYHS